MRTIGRMLVAAGVSASIWALLPLGGACARPVRHRHQALHVVPPPPTAPSQDAVELATLAPPARLSTIEQTYGDAAFARRRLQRRIERETQADAEIAAADGGMPYPCEPRVAGTSATICNGAPHERSYGQGYAFTPSYLGAPQRLGVPPDEQSPVLPPETGFAWVLNSLRYDPHN